MEHLRIKQREEKENFREQKKKCDKDHQEQINNLKKAKETALWKQQKENHENTQILNREIFNLKKQNENNLKEIKRLTVQANRKSHTIRKGTDELNDEESSFEGTTSPRRARPSFEKEKGPNYGQGSSERGYTQGFWYTSSERLSVKANRKSHTTCESTDESSEEESSFKRTTSPSRVRPSFEMEKGPNDRQGSFESGCTQGFWYTSSQSTVESSDKEASFEGTNSPSPQNVRIQQRTAAARARVTETENTARMLHTVEKSSFVDTMLDVVAGGAIGVGTAVSVAVPALAPIALPVAGIVSSGAMLLKKCSIM